MGFDILKVNLDLPNVVYFSGQQIQGTVRAVLYEETSCRELTVTMIGKGKVEWTERRNKSTHRYYAEEEYGKQSIVLWHGGSSDNKIRAGEHTFPFVFIIPHGIPSSFEDNYGKVYYKVKAVADIPWGFDAVDKAPFFVHNIVDLNTIMNARLPAVVQQEDDGGCCSDLIVSFDLNCDRSGFVPGEKLLLNGTITNLSSSAVEYTGAKIVQKVKFHATSKTRETCRTVDRIYRPKLGGGKIDTWHNVPLKIPALTASDLKHCSIIDVAYELQIIAKFGSCKSAKASTPLTIGSVALHREMSANPSPRSIPRNSGMFPDNHSYMPEMPSAPMLVDPRIDDPPPYSEIAPPAYEYRPYLNTQL